MSCEFAVNVDLPWPVGSIHKTVDLQCVAGAPNLNEIYKWLEEKIRAKETVTVQDLILSHGKDWIQKCSADSGVKMALIAPTRGSGLQTALIDAKKHPPLPTHASRPCC